MYHVGHPVAVVCCFCHRCLAPPRLACLALFHHSPGAPNKPYLDRCDVWWEFVFSRCLGVVSELSVFHFVLVELERCFSVASVATLLILVYVGMPFLSHLVCQDNPPAQWLVQFPVCLSTGGWLCAIFSMHHQVGALG